jgi:hypothetical protein
MEYDVYFHNNAEMIIRENNYLLHSWNEIKNCLGQINEKDIAFVFNHSKREAKSISETLYYLVSETLIEYGWESNKAIFASTTGDNTDKQWTIDFEKRGTGLNLSIGHVSNMIKNLVKSAVAIKPNNILKNFNIELCILLTVKKEMKKAGGFDGAVAEYERYISVLKPLESIIDVPLIIIGIDKLKNIVVKHKTLNSKKIGYIENN